METTNEHDIISQLRNPSQRRAAFAKVVSQYSQPLYWQIRRMVTWHDDADDVLQNTFLKAWMGIENFRGEARLSTWLHRIAYNETLTFLSRQHETISLDTSIGDDNDTDDDATLTLAGTLESDPYFDGDEAEALLQAAIASLPAKQRAVFTMKYFDEMKYEDMAEVTGTSVGGLKASYHLAVKKIEDFFHRRE
ncbi:MAG: RNA polymerase sigma factor [Bacteroidaceae bacterium]|nr:RNA polymerase sigma factor [Bacteroidaceae bacterium]